MSEFHYDNLANIEIDQLCSANHTSLKNIILTAPQEVRDTHPSLPRAVYKLLSIVLSLRESIKSDTVQQTPLDLSRDAGDDRNMLEELLSLSFEEVHTRAQNDLARLVQMIHAALRADDTLEPKEFTESEPSAAATLVLKWQLDATKRALHRREASPVPTPDAGPSQYRKRLNPMDVSQDSDDGIKKQKSLRVAVVPTGELDEESQDFRYGLRNPSQIRPSQLKVYLGKTTVLLNVQELMGPSILHSFCQEGLNIELVVRNVRWQRQADGRPYSSEIEALTLARCLHFNLCNYRTMEDAIALAPWTEIALRRLWALLEVQTLNSGPIPLNREEAWQQVLPSLEVYPDVGIRVPAMRSVVNRQISAESRARSVVRTLTRRPPSQPSKSQKSRNEKNGERQ